MQRIIFVTAAEEDTHHILKRTRISLTAGYADTLLLEVICAANAVKRNLIISVKQEAGSMNEFICRAICAGIVIAVMMCGYCRIIDEFILKKDRKSSDKCEKCKVAH